MKRFSASSAAQLMQCHGSAHLELAIPGYVEPQRDEMAGAKGVGTRMHDSFKAFTTWTLVELIELSELVSKYSRLDWRLRRRYLADTRGTEAQKWFDSALSFIPQGLRARYIGWLVDLDLVEQLPPKMLRYVVDALEYYAQLIQDAGVVRTRQIHAEESLVCDWLPSKPLTTPDVVILTDNTLDVLDWKTGTIPVDPMDNDQLMFYLASALNTHVPRRSWHEYTLRGHVVQPGNQASVTVEYDELMAWMQDAVTADRAILRKDLALQPGDHCTFCPANPHSRGDKAAPWCPPMFNMLYPDTTNNDEILDL